MASHFSQRWAIIFALLATALCAGWNTAVVRTSYEGNWSGLFCVGDTPLPAGEPFNHFYKHSGTQGFDGQFYLLVAIDPLFHHGMDRYIDWPALRYNRILVPELANLFALGNPEMAVAGYVITIWLMILLGSWSLGDHASRHGRHPAWAFAFLLLPAVWISLDRMVVDVALLALVLAAVNASDAGRVRWTMFFLAAACLTRESGLVAVCGFAAWHFLRREWRRGAECLLAITPALLWWWHVDISFPLHLERWAPTHPYGGSTHDLGELMGSRSARHPLGRVLDMLAIGAMLGSFAWVVRSFWLTGRQLPIFIGGAFGALGVYLFSLDDWLHVYDYGRVLSPILAMMVVSGILDRRPVLLAPSALILIRVWLQMAPQTLRMFTR